MNFVKFLRTPFLQNASGQLLLFYDVSGGKEINQFAQICLIPEANFGVDLEASTCSKLTIKTED